VLVTFGLFTQRKTIITKMSYNVGQSIVAKSTVLCVGDIRSLHAAKPIITKMSYNVGQSIVAMLNAKPLLLEPTWLRI
jgi:hypothetical protein